MPSARASPGPGTHRPQSPSAPAPAPRHTMGAVVAACLRLMDASRGRMLLENDISSALRHNADLDALHAATASNSALLVGCVVVPHCMGRCCAFTWADIMHLRSAGIVCRQ